MGLVKQRWMEEQEEEMSDSACKRCGDLIPKQALERGADLCEYCNYVIEKEIEEP